MYFVKNLFIFSILLITPMMVKLRTLFAEAIMIGCSTRDITNSAAGFWTYGTMYTKPPDHSCSLRI